MTNDEIAINMRAIITECLYGPGGDPTSEHLMSAAIAFHVLESVGLLNADDEEHRAQLEGANVYDENFLLYETAYGNSPIIRGNHKE